MALKVRMLRGRVVADRGSGYSGVRVQLCRRAGGRASALATETADAAGEFQIDLDRALRENDRGPFVFKVFDNGRPLAIRRGGTWRLQPGRPLVAKVVVERPALNKTAEERAGEPLLPGLSVRGRVVRQKGATLDGLTVRLYQVQTDASGAASRTQIGTDGTTDSAGAYLFDGVSFSGPYVAVQVEVLDGADVVGNSDAIPNPADHALIDIYAEEGAGTTEFERVSSVEGDTVGARLQGVTLVDLTADALAVVHSTTLEEPATIGRFAAAMRLAERLPLTALGEDPDADATGVMYALLSKGLPASPVRLAEQPPERIEQAILAALDEGTITYAGMPEDLVTAAVNDVVKVKHELSFDSSVMPAAPGALGELLAQGRESIATEMEAILDAIDAHGSDTDALWSTIDTALNDPDTLADVKRTVRLGILTLNHPPAVAAILDHDSGAIEDPKELAELSQADWQTLVDSLSSLPAGLVGADDTEKKASYIAVLQHQVERAYPSAVLHKAIRDDAGASADVKTFLTNNPDFDFGSTDITDAMGSAEVVDELRAYQRLFRLMPELDKHGALEVLKGDGVVSAVAIERMGRQRFIDTYGPQLGTDPYTGEPHAPLVYDKARLQSTKALGLLTAHHGGLQGPKVRMVPEIDTTDADSQVTGYSSLFGGLSYCACKWCNSVHGPAAYIADVLAWLQARGALTGGSPPYTLNGRRGDLCALLLDCNNTDVLLPYIDLVNEVLEEAVADSDDLPTVTEGTSNERLVAPQYRNPDAYVTGSDHVGDASYPNALPFHLPLAEMRAFLAPMGIDRLQLMRSLTRTGAPTADLLAAEELGLSPAASALINAASPPDSWERWGFADGPTMVAQLKDVGEFLHRAGITHPELLDLLHTRYAGQDDVGGKDYAIVGDPCDIAAQEIQDVVPQDPEDPDAVAYTRMDRFIRTWRATGWSMLTLDKVIQALGGTLDSMVEDLADVHRIVRDTQLHPTVLLTWWGTMDTFLDWEGKDEQEECLFDRVFGDPTLPGDPGGIELGQDRDELSTISSFSDHAQRVQAALAVTSDGLDAILTALGLGAPNDTLNLANLTAAYARATLSRHLDLTPADLERLLAATGADPFNGPPDTIAFLETAKRAAASGLSLDEILYLTSHEAGAADRLAPSEEEVKTLLGRLRDKLYAAREGAGSVEDDRFEEVLPRHVGDVFGLEEAAVRAIADVDFTNVGTIADVFGDDTFIDYPASVDPWSDLPGSFADAAKLAEILGKVALLVGRLDASPDEVAALPVGSGLVDLAGLAADSGSGPSLAQLLDTIDAFAARETLGGEGSWADVLAALGDGESAVAAALEARTALPASEFTYWLTAFGDDAAGLAHTAEATGLARAAAVDAATLDGWATATPTSADPVIAAARARYTDFQSWAAVARPIRDELRMQQRDALVAFLVGRSHGGAKDADDLYAYFLLDVQMSPCAVTSRLRQAMSSIQLYTQRCLLGLEPGITFDHRDAAEWEWMKTYRVWEAARKVFLWPENWFDPQLRIDKTPFFEDMEQALLQEDITDASVEDAFVGYLDHLFEVSRLEPIGTWRERDDEVDVLHVIGRTRAKPHRHFHRRREAGVWSAWEALDVEIESDHVIPVVHNRRLMVFWPSFTAVEKTEVEEEYVQVSLWQVPMSAETVTTVFQTIELNWTSRTHKGWAAPVKGTPRYHTWWGQGTENAQPEHFRFTATSQDEELHIDVTVGAHDQGSSNPSHLLSRFVFDDASLDLRRVKVPVFEALISTNENRIPAQTRPRLQGWRPEDTTVLAVLGAERTFAQSSDRREMVLLSARDDLGFVVPPGQYMPFTSQDTFFISGSRRVYVVDPLNVGSETSSGVANAVPSMPGINPDPNGTYYAPTFADLPDNDRTIPTGRYTETGDADEELDLAWALIQHANADDIDTYTATGFDTDFTFTNFYHPFAHVFLREVNRHGVMSLLAPEPDGPAPGLVRQALTEDPFSTYLPRHFVREPHPVESIDFDLSGAYSAYNWEVFFHAPLWVAEELRKNQRFDEAMRWYHTIFDPRRWDDSDPMAVWRIKPLAYPLDQPVTDLGLYTGEDLTPEQEAAARDFEALVAMWRQSPFDPNLVARLRPGAYHRTVVLRYIQNLIEWGDHLFRQYTMETVNEATQLYVLASEILGAKPVDLGHSEAPQGQSFNDLADDLDALSNVLVGVEQILSESHGSASSGPAGPSLPYFPTAYFCTPPNERLLGLWDTVADRLFKIRHCRTIEGELQALPLFEPPIDPGLLVRAAAAGVSLSTVMGAQTVGLPHQRFSFVYQRAMSLVGSVQRLGNALLSAMEKRDAEGLAVLRSGHELVLLRQIRTLKVDQVKEAKAATDGLKKSREAVQQRHDYYDRLLQDGWLPGEVVQLASLGGSAALQSVAEGLSGSAAASSTLPDAISGVVGAFPTAIFMLGGSNLSRGSQNAAQAVRSIASMLSTQSTSIGIIAGYERRAQEWTQQRNVAATELEGLDEQVKAADLRVAIAEKDLANHDKQVANAQEADRFLRSKFTSSELYSWMVGQVSGMYFQAYQLAFDIVRQAERCFAHEVALDPNEVSFIRFGGWDSLKKGLLAGERLHADLERMEATYAREDQREFELTKNVSLDLLDPLALVELRETGACTISIPEAWFDLDYSGHYFRRLRAVTVSMPSVSGPIAGLSAELGLTGNKVRFESEQLSEADYQAQLEGIRSNDGAPTVIATSTGTDDGGVFSLDWNSPQYLPFERAGAISDWSLKLSGSSGFGGLKTFDWQSIADVVLTLRYTARSAPDLRTPANDSIALSLENYGLKRAFRAAVDFPDLWHAFLNPEGAPAETVLTLPVTSEHFPYPFREAPSSLQRVELLMRGDVTVLEDPDNELAVAVKVNGADDPDGVTIDLTNPQFGLASGGGDLTTPVAITDLETVTVTASRTDLDDLLAAEALEDLIVVLHYDIG